jgi:hypothetical protein
MGYPVPEIYIIVSVNNVDTLLTDYLKNRICVCKCKPVHKATDFMDRQRSEPWLMKFRF